MDEYALDVLGPDFAGAVLEEFPVLALWGEGLCGSVCVVGGGQSGGTHCEGEDEEMERGRRGLYM